MAKLMKLQISGIRSFGPFEENNQQLKFASPLTLILGQNGCGKTTIIESLKYVCSGDLPGGTMAGQGFVNDPKMSGLGSTKGQIKLRLLDPRGNEVTVSRIVEVIQKQTNMSFRASSSSIRIQTPDGNDKSISGRCADITSECCQIMNVSPSVINNVIFCHQENSAWPLDEGKKLKEKFDDIFDAQKYNKCSEFFRKQVKDKEAQIKVLVVHVSHTKEKKQFVEQQRRILQGKEDKLQTFEDNIKSKKEQLEPIKNRIDEIFELEQVLSDLRTQLTSKEATEKGVVEEQNTIKKNLPFEFEGSDGELRDKIESFATDRQKDEKLISELEKRKNDIEDKNKVVNEAITEAQTRLGKLNQEKSHYEKKCLERTKLIAQARDRMNVDDLRDFNDNDGARSALYELKTNLESSEMCLASMIEEHDEEERKLQTAIDQAREDTVRTRQNKISKENEAKQCEQKIVEIDSQFTMLSSNDDFLKTCSQRLDAIDKTLYKLNNTFRETEESQKIDNWKGDIRSMERDLENLEGEYKILLQNDIIEGKIESEKHTIMEKQKEINRLKLKHSDALKQLFGDKVPERNLKDSVLTMQRNADTSIKNLTERITKKQKEVTTLDIQNQHQKEKIATYEKELKTNKDKIAQVCNGRDFNETLSSTLQKKERLQIDKGQYSSVEIIYGQFIKKFQEQSPCCPICETDFSQKSGTIPKILTSLNNKLKKVPQELDRVKNELQKEEALYNKLQQLKLVNEETESVEKEKLPQLRQQLTEIGQSLKTNMAELDELKSKLAEPQKVMEISKNVISDVSSLDNNQSDVERCKRTVDNLKQELVRVPSNKSKQEVEAEIENVKAEASELRGKIDAQTKKMNSHRDRVQQLQQEKLGLINKQMRLTETLQSRPTLEAQKTEYATRIETLKEEIAEFETNMYLLEAELKNCTENKNTITLKNKQLAEEERTRIKTYGTVIQDIENLQKEIDSYLNNEVDSKLAAAEDKLNELRSKERTLEETKTKILDAISEKKEDLAKQELKFRTLKNNVILREKKALETKLQAEIEDLKTRIGGYNYRTVYEEKRRLTLQREELDKQINNISGEKNGLILALDELREELDKPENKKADANYLKKLYELKIAEKVVEDLNYFISALEKSVLEFHKSKMVEINRQIRELWRDIYRGNDIDHIEIKTEYATGNARKRSYDYKVIQVKKGIELDMRGRCSAGQKVLACLIIRMALAETLSANCGILALDEPTTNLDRENIMSLCDTLTRIVNTRQQEKNFQLLVITHDEEFVSALTRAQGVSFYYRVTRDDEGFSVIKKEYSM